MFKFCCLYLIDEGLLDKHTVDIEELKKKMEGATFGGEGPSLEEMDRRYARKDEPDLTIVRIEELEAMSEMLCFGIRPNGGCA